MLRAAGDSAEVAHMYTECNMTHDLHNDQAPTLNSAPLNLNVALMSPTRRVARQVLAMGGFHGCMGMSCGISLELKLKVKALSDLDQV